MPTLLPRESTCATSVIRARVRRPSPSVHRVGFSSCFTRLLIGSLALRPAILLFGNSRPRVATTPLPHATEAYGQLLGRDFNPLDLLLLLRTNSPRFLARHHKLNVLQFCPALDLAIGFSHRGTNFRFGRITYFSPVFASFCRLCHLFFNSMSSRSNLCRDFNQLTL